jgi:hypothetical protein
MVVVFKAVERKEGSGRQKKKMERNNIPCL